MFPQNRYLNYLIDPSFQVVNRIFVLAFENETEREVHKNYYLPIAEVKDYNFVIDGRKFIDQPIKMTLKHMITLERLQLVKEMVTQQGIY